MYKMIYFFGPDGTGKTTHADLVATRLRLRGFKVWRASIKNHHTIAYLLLKFMNLGGYNMHVINYYGFHDDLARKVNKVWGVIEFFSVLPVIFYRIYFPMILGYVVVCDRYVLDTLVTLSFFLRERKYALSVFARVLVKLIPRGSLLILFDADGDVIMLRKPDEPLSIKLITYYKRMYPLLLKIYGLKAEKIDTTNVSIKHAQKRIATLMGQTSSV